jgi:hypothetical protein
VQRDFVAVKTIKSLHALFYVTFGLVLLIINFDPMSFFRINVYCASWVPDKSTSAPKLLDSVFRSFVDMKNLVQSVNESKL